MSRAFRAIIRHGLKRGLPSKAGFSRRDLLKGGARAGAAAALLATLPNDIGCMHSMQMSKAGKGKRFIIVGAGFGGLTAADMLHDAGGDVVVLEASDRVGGRVFTDRNFIPNKTVELGGELIGTPEVHPTWHAYAKKFKLNLAELEEYEGDSALIVDGKLLSPADADALYKKVDAALATIVEAAKPIDSVRPWKSPGATDLDKTSYLEAIKRFDIDEQVRHMLISGTEADQGVTADKQSMLGYLAMVKGGRLADYYTDAETHRCRGGNDSLASAIAKKLGDRINLKTEVKSIERKAGSVTVTTASGATYEGDAVVLAIPPSVWESIKITPALDGSLKPQMGKNVKLMLSIKSPVWEEKKLVPDLESDTLVNYAWVSADAGASGPPIGFTFFSGATDAEELRSLSPEERPRQAIAAVSPAYPALSDSVIKHRFMDWPSMPRVKASYSFPGPGEIEKFGPTLVDGITGDGLAPLKFAGEHTSYGFVGYMEGALSSGVRTAKQLLSKGAVT